MKLLFAIIKDDDVDIENIHLVRIKFMSELAN